MEPTKIAARLPGMDVEIRKQAFPERNMETISVHITATPSFDVATRWLFEAAFFPMMPVLYAWANLLQAWHPTGRPSLPDSASGNLRVIK